LDIKRVPKKFGARDKRATHYNTLQHTATHRNTEPSSRGFHLVLKFFGTPLISKQKQHFPKIAFPVDTANDFEGIAFSGLLDLRPKKKINFPSNQIFGLI